MGSKGRWEDGDPRRIWYFLRTHERQRGQYRRRAAVPVGRKLSSEQSHLAVRAAMALGRTEGAAEPRDCNRFICREQRHASDTAAELESTAAGSGLGEPVCAGATYH